mmetsp:Transcript_3262/g.6108  ORF Transcript_3262/g.6108 Transcript_3262/m.6108 type:complete len:276 (-) Transcript_3262:1735-2562(-)
MEVVFRFLLVLLEGQLVRRAEGVREIAVVVWDRIHARETHGFFRVLLGELLKRVVVGLGRLPRFLQAPHLLGFLLHARVHGRPQAGDEPIDALHCFHCTRMLLGIHVTLGAHLLVVEEQTVFVAPLVDELALERIGALVRALQTLRRGLVDVDQLAHGGLALLKTACGCLLAGLLGLVEVFVPHQPFRLPRHDLVAELEVLLHLRRAAFLVLADRRSELLQQLVDEDHLLPLGSALVLDVQQGFSLELEPLGLCLEARHLLHQARVLRLQAGFVP